MAGGYRVPTGTRWWCVLCVLHQPLLPFSMKCVNTSGRQGEGGRQLTGRRAFDASIDAAVDAAAGDGGAGGRKRSRGEEAFDGGGKGGGKRRRDASGAQSKGEQRFENLVSQYKKQLGGGGNIKDWM